MPPVSLDTFRTLANSVFFSSRDIAVKGEGKTASARLGNFVFSQSAKTNDATMKAFKAALEEEYGVFGRHAFDSVLGQRAELHKSLRACDVKATLSSLATVRKNRFVAEANRQLDTAPKMLELSKEDRLEVRRKVAESISKGVDLSSFKTKQEVSAAAGDRQPDRKGYLFDADAPNVLSVQLARDTTPVLKLYFKQEQYDLSFDPNGGTINGSSAPLVIRAGFGDTVIIPAAPVRSGYTFDYWKGSVYRPRDKYVVEGTHRFTAQWKQSSGGGTDPGDTPAQPDPGKDTAEPTRPAPVPAAGDAAAPVAPTVQPAAGEGTPPTGDASRTALWTTLMLLAMAVTAAGVIRRRGQKR